MPCMSPGWKKGMTPCCRLWRKTALNAGCFTRTVSETLTLSARRVWDSEVSHNSEIKLLIWSYSNNVVNTKVFYYVWWYEFILSLDSGIGSVSHFMSCCRQNPGSAVGVPLDPPASLPSPAHWPEGLSLDALGLARMPKRKDGTTVGPKAQDRYTLKTV